MQPGTVPGIILWLIIITPATVNLFKGDGAVAFYMANALGAFCYVFCRAAASVPEQHLIRINRIAGLSIVLLILGGTGYVITDNAVNGPDRRAKEVAAEKERAEEQAAIVAECGTDPSLRQKTIHADSRLTSPEVTSRYIEIERVLRFPDCAERVKARRAVAK